MTDTANNDMIDIHFKNSERYYKSRCKKLEKRIEELENTRSWEDRMRADKDEQLIKFYAFAELLDDIYFRDKYGQE